MTGRDDLTRRGPRTDAEWARDVASRLRRLEAPSETLRIGQWVVSVVDGELVAVAPGRSPVSLTAPLAAVVTEAAPILHRTFTITITGSPTGGTWSLRFKGSTTTDLDHNATTTEIRDALVALSSTFSNLDFSVTGSTGAWTVIVPAFGNLYLNASALTGGTDPTIAVVRV